MTYVQFWEKNRRAISHAKPAQDAFPEYFIQWLQKQNLSPKELVKILSRCQNKNCETIMTEAACHIAPARIKDTAMVQAMDLHVYDAFLRGKAGAAA